MRTRTFLLVAMLAATTVLALAPAAEAKQICTFNERDCDGFVCVYNRLTAEWECVGHWDPCNFRCWGP